MKTIKEKEKRKGIVLLEGIVTAGLFSIFIALTLPLIKQSIRIKNTVRNELRYDRNFIFVMENINDEIKNSGEIKILDDGKKIEIQKEENKKIVYYFTGTGYGSNFIRYTVENGVKLKDDIVFEAVKGKFF